MNTCLDSCEKSCCHWVTCKIIQSTRFNHCHNKQILPVTKQALIRLIAEVEYEIEKQDIGNIMNSPEPDTLDSCGRCPFWVFCKIIQNVQFNQHEHCNNKSSLYATKQALMRLVTEVDNVLNEKSTPDTD